METFLSLLEDNISITIRDLFDEKPVIRNLTPEYSRDFILTRGHMRIQVKSNPEQLIPTEEDYCLCNIFIIYCYKGRFFNKSRFFVVITY